MRRPGTLLPALVLTAAGAGWALGGILDQKVAQGSAIAPPEHRRGTEQTFLTYPEWFLVFSPAEYAAFVKDHPPSEFPFWGHIRQFWGGYRAIAGAARNYPPNPGYHVMIWVIGASTTVEYGCRSLYETLVGRLSQLTARAGGTEEDRFAAEVAQEYVDFIRVHPWFEFDFAGRLGALWRDLPLWGPNPIRKWERRYALTTEYATKALYGWALGRASRASYDDALPVTAVVLDPLSDWTKARFPELQVLTRLEGGRVLATLPRYQAFTRSARFLAGEGVSFEEIAGNRTVILVTVQVPICWVPPAAGVDPREVLFAQPVLTQPDRKRVGLVVPVPALSRTLRGLEAGTFEIEHVYDY
jgi:hypothetical protein